MEQQKKTPREIELEKHVLKLQRERDESHGSSQEMRWKEVCESYEKFNHLITNYMVDYEGYKPTKPITIEGLIATAENVKSMYDSVKGVMGLLGGGLSV